MLQQYVRDVSANLFLFLKFQVEFQLLYPDDKNFEKVFKEKFLFKILALANRKNMEIPDCPDGKLIIVYFSS